MFLQRRRPQQPVLSIRPYHLPLLSSTADTKLKPLLKCALFWPPGCCQLSSLCSTHHPVTLTQNLHWDSRAASAGWISHRRWHCVRCKLEISHFSPTAVSTECHKPCHKGQRAYYVNFYCPVKWFSYTHTEIRFFFKYSFPLWFIIGYWMQFPRTFKHFFVLYWSIVNNVVFFFCWLYCMACGLLLPWPGMEPRPLTVKAPSTDHRTTREFPQTHGFLRTVNFQTWFCHLLCNLGNIHSHNLDVHHCTLRARYSFFHWSRVDLVC